MWTVLCALCVLWPTPILYALDGSCPRKEPPPGVVIVSLGSKLVLTCSGHVIVNRVKQIFASHSFSDAVTYSTLKAISHNAVLMKQYTSVNMENADEIIPTSSSSSVSQPTRPKYGWDDRPMDRFNEFTEEEKGEEAKKFNTQWKFNNKGIQGNAVGSMLSLSHVRKNDSGRYSCHHGDAERFSIRIIVTEAPETPHVSCYKKSPSSKIRCEWIPLKPIHKGTSCSLLIRKRLIGWFDNVPCSYSARRSRCWCALDHNEEERRMVHQVILCVSSLIGNATSEPLSFKPMQILKPDPPYNVSIQSEAGLNQPLTVTWKPPFSWKFQDRFYQLIYEIRYKPVVSINYQTVTVYEHTRHTITDAKGGEEYAVQVRTKDEYEGQWSDWSAPQYGHSWIEESEDDLSMTPFPYSYSEGSGAEDTTADYSVSKAPPQVISHHYLWMMLMIPIAISFTISVVYIIRYKDKCMSKLQNLGVLAQCSEPVHPQHTPDAAPTVAERLLNSDRPPIEVREKSEQELGSDEKIETTNFNNTSYFLVSRKI